MKILLVGAGGVGGAFTAIAARRDFFEAMVVADYDLARAEKAAATDDRWPGPNLLADAVHGLELYRANAKGPRIRPGTRRASARVLVLIPLDDPYVTPALWDGIERFAPDLRRLEVPGKHWLPRSQPRVVADAVAAHVAGGDGR